MRGLSVLLVLGLTLGISSTGCGNHCEFSADDVCDLSSVRRNRGLIDALGVRHGIDHGGGVRM